MDNYKKEIEIIAYFKWQEDPKRSPEENWKLAETEWLEKKRKECENKIKVSDLYSNFGKAIERAMYSS